MSIMRCEKHDRFRDTDSHPDCPDCEDEAEADVTDMSKYTGCNPEVLGAKMEALIRERDEAIARIADGIGELYAAALSDHASAGYDEVGLNGVPIKVWREAYVEGCKDMAEKVAAHLGEGFRGLVLQAIEKHRALLSNREG